jgi:hypothetical protein
MIKSFFAKLFGKKKTVGSQTPSPVLGSFENPIKISEKPRKKYVTPTYGSNDYSSQPYYATTADPVARPVGSSENQDHFPGIIATIAAVVLSDEFDDAPVHHKSDEPVVSSSSSSNYEAPAPSKSDEPVVSSSSSSDYSSSSSSYRSSDDSYKSSSSSSDYSSSSSSDSYSSSSSSDYSSSSSSDSGGGW